MFWFIVSAIAVWRVTHMLQDEQGPGRIVERFRGLFVKKDGDQWTNPDSLWAQGFLCFYCLSMWTALPAAIWLAQDAIQFIAYWFALSGAAVFINILHERNS